MSLADQIAEMEDDLHIVRAQCSDYEDTIRKLESTVDDLETENWDLADFVDFVDKTSPELRVAYDAVKALQGEKT
jgi:archaellum component FlaC